MPPATPAARPRLLHRLRALPARLRKPPSRREISWGLLLLGVALAGVGLWPLGRAAWELLGLTGTQTLQVSVAILGVVVAAGGAVGLPQSGTGRLIVAAWVVATGAIAVMVALAWLVLGAPAWRTPEELTPQGLDAIATRAFAVVAGLGAVALLVIHYRRQRTTESGEQREQTRLFNERFTAAYTELGSEHAAVRLGAVHALAHLADDAPSEEQVQMVIDVLCAYLRMPYEPAPEPLPEDADEEQRDNHRARELDFASFREVRHTIIRIIGDHLREDTRWRGKNYDFTGVVFDGGGFHKAVFSGGRVDFGGAWFSGRDVDFGGAVFSGGRVNFSGARFSGSHVNFFEAEFSGGQVDFVGARFSGGTVSFLNAEFSGSTVVFFVTRFSGGTVGFGGARFSGGDVGFIGAEFSGGDVYFSGARFSGGTVSFSAWFSGGRVDFFDTWFSGGDVDFGGAEFSGGHVDFAGGPGGNPPPASGQCPAGLTEAVAAGVPGVVALPPEWEPSSDTDGDGERGAGSGETSEGTLPHG